MNYILFDDHTKTNLLPLTFTRTVADLRVGILTIREKWELFLNAKTSSLTDDYLSKKYPIVQDNANILINGSVVPNKELAEEVKNLGSNQILASDETIIAMSVSLKALKGLSLENTESNSIQTLNLGLKLNNLWDIFTFNNRAIRDDFELLTAGKKSKAISKTNRTIGSDIFIEKGAKVEHAVLNSSTGPIYIGRDAEVMEGALIRGPFALCDNSQVKMGAKIYGATTVGPYSKIGGELNNVVFLGYANKAHDGFLGNSVIGEWCNLGADTNNSNLKNNYEEVKLWNYASKKFESTGLQFCGLIMGDHSKCGINTMFNTGTVVGISASIFGPGFQRNFIPSFSWGGASRFTTYEINKAIDVAQRVLERRDMELDENDKEILSTIYDLTLEYRYL